MKGWIIPVVPQEILVLFGRRVRALRMARGWSQERLAEESRLHRNYVGGIGRGERNVSLVNVGRLARALGLTPSALFRGVGVEKQDG